MFRYLHISILFLFPFIALGQSNGCPEVTITDINDNTDIAISCATSTECVDLVANYPKTGTPTSYEVTSIPYEPLYPFSGLANPISVNIDDVWSDPKVTLPFSFCFYNRQYTEAVVSSNGAISFDISNINDNGINSTSPGNPEAADECAWEFDLSIPNPDFPKINIPKKIRNAIYGVFHDIDPSEGGQIGWEVFGTYPCRALVVSYYNVPLFDCIDVMSTFQMVLYESTNIIEVYIEEKAPCSGWNNGNSVIGIQNALGTEGLAPEGRNTGNWVASNEAWQFTPSGTSNTTVTWTDLSTNTIISNEDTLTVCPEAGSEYEVEVVFSLCDGSIITSTDTVTISYTDTAVSNTIFNYTTCDEDETPQDGLTLVDLSIFDDELINELNSANVNISYHLTLANALENILAITPPNLFETGNNPQHIFGRIEDTNTNCVLIKEIAITIIAQPSSFSATATNNPFSNQHQITVSVTGNSVYLFSLNEGAQQEENIFNNVNPGLHYITIYDSNGCFEEQIPVVIIDYPRFFTPNGDGINDTWMIIGTTELIFIDITIFDRFGKFITKLEEGRKGWDGNYNGSPLPATDYWFKIIYIEKNKDNIEQEFVGHFTLKR